MHVKDTLPSHSEFFSSPSAAMSSECVRMVLNDVMRRLWRDPSCVRIPIMALVSMSASDRTAWWYGCCECTPSSRNRPSAMGAAASAFSTLSRVVLSGEPPWMSARMGV